MSRTTVTNNQRLFIDGGTIIGSNNVIFGDRNTITGSNATVNGNNNRITGSNCKVTGNGNVIVGSNATVMGNNNEGEGSNANVSGTGNRWRGSNTNIRGANNRVDDQAFPAPVVNAAGDYFAGDDVIVYRNGNSDENDRAMPAVGVRAPPDHPIVEQVRAQLRAFATVSPSPRAKEKKFVEGPQPSEVQHDTAAPDNGPTCIVCLTNSPNCIALECMHLCFCVGCARVLCFGPNGDELKERGTLECPECRQVVKSIKRTHT